MDVKRLVHVIGWVFNIGVILLLAWSFFSYKVLENSLTGFVQAGGFIALVLVVTLLEGAPILVGSSVAVAAMLAMGADPQTVFVLFIVSAIIGNIIYYYLGYFSGRNVLRYFNKKDVDRYERLFKKYGRLAMFIMAISPIPYFPTLAGSFKMSPFYMFTEVLCVRLIRHTIVFFFWYVILI